MHIDVQLREMHSEIKTLENHKRQIEIYLEDKVKEADTLTLKIHELDLLLSKEKEEGKRFANKIKKFIKARNRHMQLQDELKRYHAQLQKLGEQLGLGAAGAAMPGNDNNSKINTLSDDITGAYYISPLNEGQISSPHRKRSQVLDGYDALNQAGGWTDGGKVRVDKVSRQSGRRDHWSSGKKTEADGDPYNGHQTFTYEDKSNRGISMPFDIPSADKYKVSETGPALPSTRIAAHAMYEEAVVDEMDDKMLAIKAASTGVETEVSLKTQRLPLPFPPPPLPPVPENAYAKYKGDNETVDIDGVDEDAVEVDIV